MWCVSRSLEIEVLWSKRLEMLLHHQDSEVLPQNPLSPVSVLYPVHSLSGSDIRLPALPDLKNEMNQSALLFRAVLERFCSVKASSKRNMNNVHGEKKRKSEGAPGRKREKRRERA